MFVVVETAAIPYLLSPISTRYVVAVVVIANAIFVVVR